MEHQVFSLHPVDLERTFKYSCDSILVIDMKGQVIMANPAAEDLLKIKHEELVKGNVQDFIAKGYYDRSTSLEAAQTKKIVTGLITIADGFRFMATSVPLLNEQGEVFMVITNSPDQAILNKYIKSLPSRVDRKDEYNNRDSREMIAESPVMKGLIKNLEVLAKVDSTILIQGSSGTGKEVFATYLHQKSLRASKPFVPVNCAAIPKDLMEAEFFGYVRGAFSGACAQGKPGFFEMADQGTLFLDELGELPLAMQSKLLRVLETHKVQRLGSTELKSVNVRIVAATNRNLAELVDQKLFRSDLYYRLNVIPIVIPDLKDRPADILALAQYFLRYFNEKYGYDRVLSPQTEQAFLEYDWPGNVRELRNVIERLVIISPSRELVLAELKSPNEMMLGHGESLDRRTSSFYEGTLKNVLQKVESQYIEQVLTQCKGNVSQAARQLGLHRTALHRKLRLLQNG